LEDTKDIASFKDRFINRELSWLAFNKRVLEEASNASHPILERVKFLSISASNLDEFYMVRVASIRNKIIKGETLPEPDGLTPNQALKLINKSISELIVEQNKCWKSLKKELKKHRINILNSKNLNSSDVSWLENYFTTKIFPEITPIMLYQSTPMPAMQSLGMAIVLTVKKKDTKKVVNSIIPLPPHLDRLIELPGENGERFILLEEAISLFQESLFPGCTVENYGLIRVTRDSEVEVAEDEGDFIRSFESALEQRRKGHIVKLRISKGVSTKLKKFLIEKLSIDESSIAQDDDFIGIRDAMRLYDCDREDLKFPSHNSRFPERIDDFGGDCFAAIDKKDIIVHHPYESFGVVVQFIRQAARDPNVTSIKQTLYRTSNDSPIVQALIEAAEEGKDVTVIVEPKARFDEEANIKWGRGLEESGAKVIYGIPRLKIHAKTSLVKRKVNDDEFSYVHYGTGNYHPVTAKIYTDLSFFTSDPALCSDAEKLFTYIENISLRRSFVPKPFKKISVAPLTLRKKLIELIDREILNKRNGKKASIWAKMNSLVDAGLIDKLYEASREGVKISLIVRGICCLKPGVKDLSENITVKSIVGRFLEHSRIYCFANSYKIPSAKNEVYISSADIMPRNLDRRIELLIPIENKTIHEQVLGQIMNSNMQDEKQSWVMNEDGSYTRKEFDDYSFSAHDYFMRNPSLSGRGSAKHGKRKKEVLVDVPLSKVAVLDVGSNSVRLVIYDGLKRTPLPLFNEKVLCGLARNLEKTGNLHKEGRKLALSAIERFSYIVDEMGIEDIFAFATSAVRDSKDGKKFIQEIRDKFGIKVDILSGKEEARLSALGVASASYEAYGVVADLGGGSLELSEISFKQKDKFKEEKIVKQVMSYPIGSLRLMELTKGRLESAASIIDKHISSFPLKEALKGETLYAVGGGFRSLAKIHLELNRHPINVLQQYSVKATDFVKTLELVKNLGKKELLKLPAMSDRRTDTIKYTAEVMERLIYLGKPDYICFSTHGVREGVIFDKLIPKVKAEDALIAGCSDMISHISPDTGRLWAKYGIALNKWMDNIFDDETKYMKRLRLAACILNHISWHEHTPYRAEMAFRWVMDAEITAIDHWERAFLATTLFHRYSTEPNPAITGAQQSILSSKWKKRARMIGVAMRLGYHLSGSTPGLLEQSKIEIRKDKLVLSCKKSSAIIGSDTIRRLEKLANLMNLEAVIK